ncbi:MAG: D-alanyl-D-alanine carboxypeptidase/D-alanyl-D-alanine endopeptidase, partial [Stackebrandtia sp.]
GDVIYNHDGDSRAIPASNNKIQTSAAAMSVLGGDYTFKTDAASAAEPSGGVLGGDLFLRGTGDPSMLAEDYNALAKQIADAGVTTVEGDLVADDTAYDAVRLGTEWGWDDLPYYYAPETSALNVAADGDFNAGSVNITVEPGASEGDEAKVTVTPETAHITVDNSATTGAAGGELSVDVNRPLGSNEFSVSGQIPADGEADVWAMSVSNPTGYAATVFREALEANGVTVTGDVRQGEATPDDAASLAAHDSAPMSELVVSFMKLSNNSLGESFLKAMGREAGGEGSFSAGAEAVKEAMNSLNVNTDNLRQVDGSGMSRQNLVSPTQLTEMLVGARGQDWYDAWYDAMPIACESDPMVGGTLASRMCDTPAAGNVHGKTGSMTSVSALSGYVTDGDDRELVFSIVNNDYLADTVKDLEDKIAVTIASHSQAEAATTQDIEVPQPENPLPTDKECTWVRPVAC